MTTLTDLYPTRRPGLDRGFIARLDPVVHPGSADAAPGPLTAEQLTAFADDGFLCLKGHLDHRAVAALNQAADRLRDEVPREDDRLVREPDDDTPRSIFAVHTFSPLFAAMAASPSLAGVARQLLGGDVYLHQTRLNYKPGFAGKEFYWHSDFETWHSEDGMPRMRAVSCAVALDENFVHNGPLMIIPGSHKLFVACTGETPENHYKRSLRKQEIGVPSKEALDMLVTKGGIATMVGPPGTVVFFDCNAMHGSNGNITPHPRNNLFMVYNHVDNALQDPFCGRKPRPDHIAHRTVCPL